LACSGFLLSLKGVGATNKVVWIVPRMTEAVVCGVQPGTSRFDFSYSIYYIAMEKDGKCIISAVVKLV
jgi:hypothetical protein